MRSFVSRRGAAAFHPLKCWSLAVIAALLLGQLKSDFEGVAVEIAHFILQAGLIQGFAVSRERETHFHVRHPLDANGDFHGYGLWANVATGDWATGDWRLATRDSRLVAPAAKLAARKTGKQRGHQ